MRVVVDTSAIVSILSGEPERDRFLDLLLRSDPAISAGSVMETLRTIQLRYGAERLPDVHRFMRAARLEIIAFDAVQMSLAEDGMLRFGKRRRAEPAVLNFGDLFAYALARHLEVPLLFKGRDFALTDVTPALPG